MLLVLHDFLRRYGIITRTRWYPYAGRLRSTAYGLLVRLEVGAMATSRGETRSYRRRLRGAAALLVLAAALAPLLIGGRAQSDLAPPALTTSTTAMMASDGKSAEAAWPALTDPGWPPPDFTDPLARPRTPAAQGARNPGGARNPQAPATAAHQAPATPAPASVAKAGAASPATSPSGVDRQQRVGGAAQQTTTGDADRIHLGGRRPDAHGDAADGPDD